MLDAAGLERLLRVLGEVLASKGKSYGIVVVGGASLSLLGLVARTTSDVDVIATTVGAEDEPTQITRPPQPLPRPLREAVDRVQRDFRLPKDWINTDIAAQWTSGLPPGLPENLEWRRYGNLRVGLAKRPVLLALKLFAAVDTGPESVHYQDLLALKPRREELLEAATWVRKQDAAPRFDEMVDQVIERVLHDVRRRED